MKVGDPTAALRVRAVGFGSVILGVCRVLFIVHLEEEAGVAVRARVRVVCRKATIDIHGKEKVLELSGVYCCCSVLVPSVRVTRTSRDR